MLRRWRKRNAGPTGLQMHNAAMLFAHMHAQRFQKAGLREDLLLEYASFESRRILQEHWLDSLAASRPVKLTTPSE